MLKITDLIHTRRNKIILFVWSTLLDLYWSCCILCVEFFFKQYRNVFAFEIEAPHRAVLIFWTCIYESGFLGFTAWSCYFVALFICSERIVYSCLTLVTYDLFTQLYFWFRGRYVHFHLRSLSYTTILINCSWTQEYQSHMPLRKRKSND